MSDALTPLVERLDALLALLQSQWGDHVAAPDWSSSIAFRYRRKGPRAWLDPVRGLSPIALSDLQEIDAQKDKILQNTQRFLQGLPANNVLLTGARGTGKSSLIKACLNAMADQGLRLIEMDKGDLVDLPDVVTLVAQRPERFVIYCDDLSFEEGDPAYKALKSVLDGSVSATSANVLVYATSNRRHLLPEYMKDNLSYTHTEDGEVHPGEVIEEKISLSERFGLWVSFYPFSQDEYLTVVRQWLMAMGMDEASVQAARPAALVWALERGSRSGRVAYQFACDHVGAWRSTHGQAHP